MSAQRDPADEAVKLPLAELAKLPEGVDTCYLLMAWFDEAFTAGRFEDVNGQLAALDLSQSCSAAIISILVCITWPPDGHLPVGQALYDRARVELAAKCPGEDMDKLLSGLVWENGIARRTN